MPVTVKSISLWRKETGNKTGLLAETLEPLAGAGVDLKVVMGYRLHGTEARAAIEVCPVSGKKAIAAATDAELTASSIPTLLIEGDNRKGLAYQVAEALATAGVDVGFFVAQTVGRKYSAVIGFAHEADAKEAARLIKKVTARKK